MKIGIVGSGNVGGTVGLRWAKTGHSVTFSSRNPQSEAMQALVKNSNGAAKAATVQEAVHASELLLLATPWPAARQTIQEMGDLAGKILIDATNPLLPDLSGLVCGTTTSAGEQVAAWARGAKVVKALNTVGYNVMADPKFGSDRAAMFYCGDDKDAKATVKRLLEDLGFDALDAGSMTQARVLEPFALLWISLAYPQGYGREMAFKMLRR